MTNYEHLIRKKWGQFWFDDDFKHGFSQKCISGRNTNLLYPKH